MRFLLVLFLMSPGAALALGNVDPEKNMSQMDEISRKRLYPGGIDEEDLEVQKELVVPQKKFYQSQVQRQVYKKLTESSSSDSSKSSETEQ